MCTEKLIVTFSDIFVKERHTILLNTIGPLEMEIVAFKKAQYFSWIFFPIIALMTAFQALFYYLYNNHLHPYAKIIDVNHAVRFYQRKQHGVEFNTYEYTPNKAAKENDKLLHKAKVSETNSSKTQANPIMKIKNVKSKSFKSQIELTSGQNSTPHNPTTINKNKFPKLSKIPPSTHLSNTFSSNSKYSNSNTPSPTPTKLKPVTVNNTNKPTTINKFSQSPKVSKSQPSTETSINFSVNLKCKPNPPIISKPATANKTKFTHDPKLSKGSKFSPSPQFTSSLPNLSKIPNSNHSGIIKCENNGQFSKNKGSANSVSNLVRKFQ